MKDGPYYFYAHDKARPILVEAMAQFISECGEPDWRPLSAYSYGRFVPLVELPDVSELEAFWPAIPDLQGGLDMFAEYPISGGDVGASA